MFEGHVENRGRPEKARIRLSNLLPPLMPGARVVIVALLKSERTGAAAHEHGLEWGEQFGEHDLPGMPGHAESTSRTGRGIEDAASNEVTEDGGEVIGRDLRFFRNLAASDGPIIELSGEVNHRS